MIYVFIASHPDQWRVKIFICAFSIPDPNIYLLKSSGQYCYFMYGWLLSNICYILNASIFSKCFQGIPTFTLIFTNLSFSKDLADQFYSYNRYYVLDVLVVRMIFSFWPSFTNKLITVLRLFHRKISHLETFCTLYL